MTMTYAAQVRSMSKSLQKQTVQDDLYDMNSLRIICQYFVGNVVVVKTCDEVLEGVLHTISNNTVCLTLVTTSKSSNPQKIIKVSSSKLISLNNVLSISTSTCDKELDVTVKGKSINVTNETNKTNSLPKGDMANNKVKKINYLAQNGEKVSVIDDRIKTTISNKEILQNGINTNAIVEVENKSNVNESKKLFAFNPNAPEFKPRSSGLYSDNIFPEPVLFSPQHQPFTQMFTPSSAPAIFVPNCFFYAPNHMNGVDVNPMDHCLDGNMPLQTGINGADRFVPGTEFHVTNTQIPFAPVLPVFQHRGPIFIPSSSFQISNGHIYSPELDNTEKNNTANSGGTNNELSNPLHWPPLPIASFVTPVANPDTVPHDNKA